MEMEGDQWENDILSPFVQQKSDRTTIILNKLKLTSERYDARNPLANFLGTFASPELLWECVQTKVTGVQFYVYRTNTKLVLTHSFYSGLFWPHLLLHWALGWGKSLKRYQTYLSITCFGFFFFENVETNHLKVAGLLQASNSAVFGQCAWPEITLKRKEGTAGILLVIWPIPTKKRIPKRELELLFVSFYPLLKRE